MNTYINNSILQARNFQSDSLGVLTTICHPIVSEGDYIVTIFMNKREVDSLDFQCKEDSSNTQLDLDLFLLNNNSFAHKETLVLKKGGYLVLYVSDGDGGYHVALTKKDQKPKTIYNSQTLMPGDFFSIPLVQPGNYIAKIKEINSECKINVGSLGSNEKPFIDPAPLTIDITDKGFSQKEMKLLSTQGLIFNIKIKGSVSIQMTEPFEKNLGTERKISWKGIEKGAKINPKKKSRNK